MKVKPSERKMPLRKYAQTRDEKLFYFHGTDYFQRNVSSFTTTTSTPGEGESCMDVSDPSQPPKNGACPFYRLSRELRDIIYDYATQGTTCDVINFYQGAYKVVVWPTKDLTNEEKYGPALRRKIPSAFASPQTVSKLIFDESLPWLTRNTTFIFRDPHELSVTVRRLPLVMQHATTIRVHLYEMRTGEYDIIVNTVNKSPNIVNLALYAHKQVVQHWFRMMGESNRATQENRKFTGIIPTVRLSAIRGLTSFKLVFVDTVEPGSQTGHVLGCEPCRADLEERMFEEMKQVDKSQAEGYRAFEI